MRKTSFAGIVASAMLLLACPGGARANTPNQNFVSQAYLDLLNRPADPFSLSTFSTALDTASLTPTQVAFDIESTDEYRGVVVQGGYQLLLHRPADTLGLSQGVSLLGGGGTDEQFRAILAGSPEYLADHGGTNDGFLTAVYGDLLQRPISNSELISDESFLAGATRQQFATVVLSSTEYRQDLVMGWYEQFLHRPADSSALTGFTAELGGGATDETVISQIIGSPEYFQDAQSTPEPSITPAALGGLLLLRRLRRR
ncbi:MAG: glucose/sorbosone dehydrogenase [Phycisphaerales bacterium]|nr:glucose/sorbosone dehydrogenase [Phycisphaerales bacterium]